MDSKRKKSKDDSSRPRRRSRFDDHRSSSQANKASSNSLASNEIAEKAMKLSALQASIKAQISNASAALALYPYTGLKKARDFTLRLDDQGRQIDESGKVVRTSVHSVATLKANVDAQTKLNNPYLAHTKKSADDDNEEIDYVAQAKASRPKKAGFNFVKKGTYVKKGEQLREHELTKEHLKIMRGGLSKPVEVSKSAVQAPTAMSLALAAEKNGSLDNSKMEEALNMFPPRDTQKQPVVIEWWDEPYLPEKDLRSVANIRDTSGEMIELNVYKRANLENCRTYPYVQHPKALRGGEWIVERDSIPMPMYLTKEERKRVRRQARAEKEREKRDKMALGLLPPPPPKMKLSNFMRVLGEQAVVDPSKVEQMVRKQVAARKMGHEMSNQARKLTPEEKRAKRKKRIAADSGKELKAAIFRVEDLTNPKHRFKIDANAQQLGLTGCVVMCPNYTGVAGAGINMVAIEGGPRAIRSFVRLMVHRIKWVNEDYLDMETDSEGNEDGKGEAGEQNAVDIYQNSSKEGSCKCELLWEGAIMSRAFTSFRFQEIKTPDLARKAMAAKGVPHYWDMADF